MDKNQITGIILMIVVLIGFSYYRASQDAEELKAKQALEAKQDSLDVLKADSIAVNESTVQEMVNTEVVSVEDSNKVVNDSLNAIIKKAKYGIFYASIDGEEKDIIVDTDELKFTLSNKGGYISQVEVKNEKTYSGDPLILFTADSSTFNYSFGLEDIQFQSDQFYFKPSSEGFSVTGENSKTLSFSLKASTGEEILHEYRFLGNDYMVTHNVTFKGLGNKIKTQENFIDLNWEQRMPNLEKTVQAQKSVNGVFYYDVIEEEDDYLSEVQDDEEIIENPIKWACFKQQYFSSFLIADSQFGKSSEVKLKVLNSQNYVKHASATLKIPFSGSNDEKIKTKLFFGPSKIELLDSYDLEMGNIVNYGIGMFHWMNKYFIGPMFNFFMGLGMNIGLAILLLTVVIKLILTPITYKNYLSSAKMRVLKPRIDKINEENKDADPVKKQQAMMELYRSTGINPAAGCIPPLLQMPILFAMFRFFPNAFVFRQKSFLWAEDLSAYDSVLELGFDIPFYGDHVSLFTLLMAVSIFFYSRFNSQMTPTTGNEMQMKQMKIMMNFMPVMMLFFFNSYAAGLSYYYFLSNVISIGQTVLIKKLFINEEAILQKIEEHMKKPMKKSRFQRKMEELSEKQKRK